MGLFFEFRQAVPDIFQFLYQKELRLFGSLSWDYTGAIEH